MVRKLCETSEKDLSATESRKVSIYDVIYKTNPNNNDK